MIISKEGLWNGLAYINGWFIIGSIRWRKELQLALLMALFAILLSAGNVVEATLVLLMTATGMFIKAKIGEAMRFWALRKVARQFNATAHTFRIPLGSRITFYARAARHATLFVLINRLLTPAKPENTNTYIESMYAVEYASANDLVAMLEKNNEIRLQNKLSPLRYSRQRILWALREPDECHYFFHNALFGKLFENITGFSFASLSGVRILDVGAGNAQLRTFLLRNNVPDDHIMLSDIVPMRYQKNQSQTFTGRLEELPVPKQSIQLMFLSYFMDYDSNQRETLKAAVDYTAPGGSIVIEFKAPCISCHANQPSTHMVTRGTSTADDVNCICSALTEMGAAAGRKVTIQRIFSGSRYLYNRHGAWELPSCFITARID